MKEARNLPDPQKAPVDKKPYERPRILLREPLESVAVACVPSPPGKTAGPCAAPNS